MTKLTIRLGPEDLKRIAKLKGICRETTSNKTVIFALKKALQFFDLCEEIEVATEKLERLSDRIVFR